MKKEIEKLIKIYKEHGKIIVGVDFDDTLFTFDKNNKQLHENVRKLLLDIKSKIILCLFTVADKQSLTYKEYIMEHCWDIKPHYINESPVKKWGNSVKPYFNILLDDKAGLPYTYNILNEFKKIINV